MPRPRSRYGTSSVATLIGGTRFGDTKPVTSTLRKRAAVGRFTNSTFTSAGIDCFSSCVPSPGPTSTIETRDGSAGIGDSSRTSSRDRSNPLCGFYCGDGASVFQISHSTFHAPPTLRRTTMCLPVSDSGGSLAFGLAENS